MLYRTFHNVLYSNSMSAALFTQNVDPKLFALFISANKRDSLNLQVYRSLRRLFVINSGGKVREFVDPLNQ
jgi:hypothetical protein